MKATMNVSSVPSVPPMAFLEKFTGVSSVLSVASPANSEKLIAADLDAARSAGAHADWPEPAEIKTDLPAAPVFDAKALLPEMLACWRRPKTDQMGMRTKTWTT